MDFEYGTCRYVILIGSSAVKIARIKILRYILRMLLYPFLGHKWTLSMREAFVQYMCNGVICNRNEHRYFIATNDCRVMPVRKIWLGGFVIIQERGQAVSYDELHQECEIFKMNLARINPDNDLSGESQYARHPNRKIYLIDYGPLIITNILLKTLEHSVIVDSSPSYLQNKKPACTV